MNIERFRDKHRGERAFLIGNGPSLGETPLNILSDEYTFGLNNINKIYSHTNWRPTYYTYIGTEVDEDKMDSINLEIPSFISKQAAADLPDMDNVFQLNVKVIESIPDEYNNEQLLQIWSDDISEIVYSYATSMYVVYQIAVYMGFDELYLVGCDLGYNDRRHMVFEDAADPVEFSRNTEFESNLKKYISFIKISNKTTKSMVNGMAARLMTANIPSRKFLQSIPKVGSRLGDPDHFDENYDTQIPPSNIDERMTNAHRIANTISNKKGYNIYNATLGGELEVFPRVDINEVLN